MFYPTTGVLAWYSKETGKLQPLPGADDPEYVHTSAFWSPDGSYLVFSRARARSAYAPGQKPATYANDPNETQVQYDLYRIPFNDGRGGKAEPIAGASGNGMSNNFPKVSPDGKWLVFVQNKSGLLMRPDSRLYIVPATGGTARPLRSNLAVMNSWHSFSPNGRWLVFSSKTPTPYTRLYLTHIDDNGDSTPAILIDNTTAANRAANIPEFVNVGPDGLERIEAPATESYRLFNLAMTQHEKKSFTEEVATWREVLKLTPDDARAHGNLGVALASLGKDEEALAEYNRSLQIDPTSSTVRSSLGSVLAQLGRIPEAVEQLEKAVEANPDDAGAQSNLGVALAQVGRVLDALEHARRSIELNPEVAGAQNNLASVLAQAGDWGGAEEHVRRADGVGPGGVALPVQPGSHPGFTAQVLRGAARTRRGGAAGWRCRPDAVRDAGGALCREPALRRRRLRGAEGIGSRAGARRRPAGRAASVGRSALRGCCQGAVGAAIRGP